MNSQTQKILAHLKAITRDMVETPSGKRVASYRMGA